MKWGIEIHKEKAQIDRQKRACAFEYTPLQLDDSSGTIGVKQTYQTTLKNCTCTDFQRRNKPCKHMYRLAHELGVYVLDEPVLTDSKVNEKISLENAIYLLDKLTIADMQMLLDIYYKCGNYHQSAPCCKIKRTEHDFSLLLNKGLVSFASPQECLNDFTMADLRAFIKLHPMFENQKFHNKEEIINFITQHDNILDMQQLKSNTYIYLIPGYKIEHLASTLCKKLQQILKNYYKNDQQIKHQSQSYNLGKGTNYTFNDSNEDNSYLTLIIVLCVIILIILLFFIFNTM